MISVAPALTEFGKSLLIRAIGGEQITFTKMKIGNGEVTSGVDPTDLEDLINPLVIFGISEIDTSSTGYAKVTGSFDNTAITSDFRWRELGLFCVGEETQSFNGNGSSTTFTVTAKPSIINYVKVGGSIVTVSSYNSTTGVVTLASAPASGTNNVVVYYPDFENEKLYAYVNDGDDSGKLKANATDVVTEQTVGLIVAIGTATSVTAIISESVLYATKVEFEAHTGATNPHGINKSMVGLGYVPNVTTNNQTPTYSTPSSLSQLISGERLSTAFGKISRAVINLISHINDSNNPHGDTPESIGAAEAEHTHSAADISSGVLSVSRGGTGSSNLSTLRSALGLGLSLGVLQQQYGGTGYSSRSAFVSAISSELSNLIIITGTYSGTGSYGTSNKNTLNFDKSPKLLFVQAQSYTNSKNGGFIVINGTTKVVSGGIQDDVSTESINFTWSGTTVQWYSGNAGAQCNYSGYTYNYLAIL